MHFEKRMKSIEIMCNTSTVTAVYKVTKKIFFRDMLVCGYHMSLIPYVRYNYLITQFVTYVKDFITKRIKEQTPMHLSKTKTAFSTKISQRLKLCTLSKKCSFLILI